MRDLLRMLKVTAIHASGPDYDKDDASIYTSDGTPDDDFISQDDVGDEFLWFGWLQQQEGLVTPLGWKLKAHDNLIAEWRGDQFWINLNDEQHRFPLSCDAHKTYITISSIAYLLRERYDFWLVKYLMGADTHALLITTKTETEELASNHSRAMSRWFIPLQLGHDYFSGIDVPYLDHENHNPLFEKQRDAIAPVIVKIHEEIANKGARVREVHKQRELWLNELLHDVKAPNVSVEEISRMSAELGQKITQTDKEYADIFARLREEIAQIIENSERR
ncbi:hypothetical protein [Pseudohalocynthiibacter sp. F2068]|jgi:hypothetical protein|uniref:hypothetical protein n=1 Tax=Pseudohalocynthiibacter sp. F2068 TaxID=2926418 RepID=UPI001FF4CD48|nr:hypothetical protein [Pseudohalocynthiibacter sp. F2068]MCK0102616.1 hypothetical protein [Pseudohalocynthiibacter sp. F2068]